MGILESLPETMKISFLDTFKIERGMSQTVIINRFWSKLWRKGKAFVFLKVCVQACNNGELGLSAHEKEVLWINNPDLCYMCLHMLSWLILEYSIN